MDVVHAFQEHLHQALEDRDWNFVVVPVLLEEPQRFPHWFEYKTDVTPLRTSNSEAVEQLRDIPASSVFWTGFSKKPESYFLFSGQDVDKASVGNLHCHKLVLFPG